MRKGYKNNRYPGWLRVSVDVVMLPLWRLSAVEVGVDEFLDGFVVAADVGAQSGVVVGTQLCDDAVNHSRAEHAVLLINGTLLLEAVGVCHAAVG